jgi:hypothetical protein
MTATQSHHLVFDAAGIRDQSARVRSLADDLRAVRQTWESATASPAPALGLSELISAFGSMRQAWVAQFGVYVDAVSALSDRLDAAAADYAGAETVSTNSARSVGR